MGKGRTVKLVLVWGIASLLCATGCDTMGFGACHDSMKTSQQQMIDFSQGDREDLVEATKTLKAVRTTLAACRDSGRAEEVEKVERAERELVAHVKLLEERKSRKKIPKLSATELAQLEKSGDPGCPRGQQYEHHQNGKLITCTGPQLFEMNSAQARDYFERRGFSVRAQGAKLRMERGAQVVDFAFDEENSKEGARCFTFVADPGIPWQETVTRATGVEPRSLTLGKPVRTKRGPLDLLVEGGPDQYTVKLGSCAPTPGQKALKEPAKAQ